MAHLKRRRVLHRRSLACNGFADFFAAMPRVHAPQASDAVENFATVVRPVIHPFGACEQPGMSLELAIRRKRHPEGFELRARNGIGGHRWPRTVVEEGRPN